MPAVNKKLRSGHSRADTDQAGILIAATSIIAADSQQYAPRIYQDFLQIIQKITLSPSNIIVFFNFYYNISSFFQ